MMCTSIMVHPFNGAPFNGAPFNGAPFNGAQFNGQHHYVRDAPAAGRRARLAEGPQASEAVGPVVGALERGAPTSS